MLFLFLTAALLVLLLPHSMEVSEELSRILSALLAPLLLLLPTASVISAVSEQFLLGQTPASYWPLLLCCASCDYVVRVTPMQHRCANPVRESA